MIFYIFIWFLWFILTLVEAMMLFICKSSNKIKINELYVFKINFKLYSIKYNQLNDE